LGAEVTRVTPADSKAIYRANTEFGVGGAGRSLSETGKFKAPPPHPAAGPHSALISEVRLRGPAGAEDEFIEVYNNSDGPLVVQATDTSGGWTIALSNGQITGPLFTIPN